MTKHNTLGNSPQERSKRGPYQWNATLEQVFRARFTPREFDQCWEWTGYANQAGYGKLTYKGRTYRAHRLAWQFHHGREIPPDGVICHICDNPLCVNPYHLRIGTQADNMTDKTIKGRQHRGETHPATDLTADDVREIRRMQQEGSTERQIAERIGITRSNVNHILRGNSWTHIT